MQMPLWMQPGRMALACGSWTAGKLHALATILCACIICCMPPFVAWPFYGLCLSIWKGKKTMLFSVNLMRSPVLCPGLSLCRCL